MFELRGFLLQGREEGIVLSEVELVDETREKIVRLTLHESKRLPLRLTDAERTMNHNQRIPSSESIYESHTWRKMLFDRSECFGYSTRRSTSDDATCSCARQGSVNQIFDHGEIHKSLRCICCICLGRYVMRAVRG